MTGPGMIGPGRAGWSRTLLGAAAGIAAITVVARVAGFGRTAVFSRAVGLECVGSTYQVVNALPNVVFEVVAGGALAALVVPVLAPAVAAADRASASRTASALLTWTLLLLVPVALLGVLAAPLLARAMLGADPVCGPEALETGARMLRVFMPQVVLYGLAVVLTGVLQAHRRFTGPALAPLLSTVVVVAAYLAYATTGRAALADLSTGQELLLSVGTTLGVAALGLSLLVPLRGTGLRLRPALGFPPGIARQARALAGAGVAGLAAQQLALLVALRLAAGSTASGPAVFTVALAVFLLPWAVLAVPVATSAFPALAAAEDDAAYADVARRSLRAVLVLTLLGTAVLVAVAAPVGRLLAGAGPAADELAQGLLAFAPGLVGYGLLALLARALYARGDARTPAVATVAGWLLVVVADVLLVGLTDLPPAVALGLGNAVGMTLAAVLLLAGLRRVAPAALTGTVRTLLVGLAGVALSVAALRLLPLPATPSVLVDLLLTAGLSALAGLLVLGLLAVADRAGLRAVSRG